ncbi:MAG: DUF2993 domain-containing protein [Leptolyngbyaceae cyanobacterium bins.59]|nr:DUF2993 domain-containing protein [Leptolyngbyaceae cyanobacterium bins.59]
MPDNDLSLEAQALSQAVELGLSSQLESADKIAVEVKTDLLQAMQGKAESISIAGEGVVLQNTIRVQELDIQTDRVAVSPLRALFGQLELSEPVNTIMRMTLTEADLNQALNSEMVRDRLQPFELKVRDQHYVLRPEPPMELRCQPDGALQFSGMVSLETAVRQWQVGFTAVALPRSAENPVLLRDFRCTSGPGFEVDFTIALMQKFSEFLHAAALQWEDMVFRILNLAVDNGNLVLEVEANLKQIPAM